MSYVVGQPVEDVIFVRNALNVPVDDLTILDFSVFEAFPASLTPADAVSSSLTQVDPGAYRIAFTPTIDDTWIFHYVYSAEDTYVEETLHYVVGPISSITVLLPSGGTWSYEFDYSMQKNRVRRLIPDVNFRAPLLADEEIANFTSQYDDTRRGDYLAAADCAEALADGMPDMLVESTSVHLAFSSTFWLNKAKRFRDLAKSWKSLAPAYAGGMSVSEREAVYTNTGRLLMEFEKERGQ